jgi:hypothetical protein
MNPLHLLVRPVRLHFLRRHVDHFYTHPSVFRSPADAVQRAESLSPYFLATDPTLASEAHFWTGHLYLAALNAIPGTNLTPKTQTWLVLALTHLQLTLRRPRNPQLIRSAHLLMALAYHTYGFSEPAALHYWSYLDLVSYSPSPGPTLRPSPAAQTQETFMALQALAHLLPHPVTSPPTR